MAKVNRLSGSEETYVETIHHLIQKRGYARVADIAAALDVKPPSVTGMLQRLDEEKFVQYTRYRGVTLTPKGESLAKKLETHHKAIKSFLKMIGVSEKVAEREACGIEHIATRKTISKLAKFVEFVELAPQTPPFLKHFQHYVQTGKRPTECKIKGKTKKQA